MSFRKKVTGIIFDKNGKVLIWQYSPSYVMTKKWSKTRSFPWWGKDIDERYKESLFREIHEEVWIKPEELSIVYKYKNYYFKKYNSAKKQRVEKQRWIHYKGKKQRIYLMYFDWEKKNIDLSIADEFGRFKWIKLDEISQYMDPQFIKFLKIKELKEILYAYLRNRYK